MAPPVYGPNTYTGNRQRVEPNYGYFQENPYQDRIGPAAQQSGDYGRKFLDQRLSVRGGGFGSSPASFRSKFGFSSLNPDDPRIGKWMGNLQGGMRNAMDDSSRRMAQAGAAAGRGGMGVSGGPGLGSSIAAQGLRTQAQMYPQLYGQAVGWTRDAVGEDNASASAMANLYGQMDTSRMNAGVGLMGQQLTGMTAAAADRQGYDRMASDAYGRDVGQYNQLMLGERDKYLQGQEQQRRRQLEYEQMMKQAEIDAMLRGVTTYGGPTPFSNAQQSQKEYLGTQGYFGGRAPQRRYGG